jgi:2,3-bisphosphoglycerate-independent phosphoglycerate mutase
LELKLTFGEVISLAGLSQARIAESEKERFVTYYFDGGKNSRFTKEDVLIVPSPNVATYDLQPEMSTPQITESLLELLEKGENDVFIVNFACPDMVGHTGDLQATVRAVEAVDRVIGQIAPEVLKKGGTLCITADHGNAEEVLSHTGEIDTEHSGNPVPFILVSDKIKTDHHLPLGILGDVAPTLLKILGLEIPDIMTGSSLI